MGKVTHMSAQDNLGRQFKTLYRGVNVTEHWKNSGIKEDYHGNKVTPISSLPNPINEQGGIHTNEGIGFHWTDRRTIASRFAELSNQQKVTADKKPVAAIIHAQVPQEHIYDESKNNKHPLGQKKEQETQHAIHESQIFSKGSADWKEEREHTVWPGTSVYVTKVEKFRKVGSGIKKREIKYRSPRERKA
jgi:hypothetical protein